MKIEAQCCITSFSTCPAKILIKNEYDIRAIHKPYPSYFLNATHNSIIKAIVEFIYCGTKTLAGVLYAMDRQRLSMSGAIQKVDDAAGEGGGSMGVFWTGELTTIRLKTGEFVALNTSVLCHCYNGRR